MIPYLILMQIMESILKTEHLSSKLANNIRSRRVRTTSTGRFAITLGISQSTLNKIENNNGNVTLDTLNTMCRHLKCDIADLFTLSIARGLNKAKTDSDVTIDGSHHYRFFSLCIFW